MGEYNDACALAAWAAAAFTVSLSMSSGGTGAAPMDVTTLAGLYKDTTLYNPNVPNVAEVVRQVRNSSGGSTAEIRTTVIEAIRARAEDFKTTIPAVMVCLNSRF